VFGPECTGKTTLARDLAAHYETTWVPEYLRGFVDAKLPTLPPGAPLVELAEIEAIVAGQIRDEERTAAQARRVLFCDTNPLQTAVYCEHYFGSCPAWLERLVAERTYHLYLLTDVDVPWSADPQRDRPGQRKEMHALFRGALARRRLPHAEIRGGLEERFAAARRAVDALLVRGEGASS
jgi:NadR type nicotinamide-nucleotide adenylyltransferase